MKPLSLLLSSAALCAMIQPALAQQAAPQARDTDEAETMEIVVSATRLPGAVIGDIKPEVTFTAADIRSLGVTSVSELVAELSAQTGSGQGRGGEAPVVLLNGGRVSSFAEVRSIPSEAIARVDILPEEVALKYGFRANQKVMNLVLRRRFKALSLEAEGSVATEGGQTGLESENALFRTGEKGRLNIALDYERSSPLTEAERDIIQSPTRLAGEGAFRTLRGQTDDIKGNLVWAKPLASGTTLALNAGLNYATNDGLRGLSTALEPLDERSRDWSAHAGTTLNGALGSWNWSLTANFDHSQSRSRNEIESALGAVQPGINRARSITNSGDTKLVFTGSPFAMPAGSSTLTLTMGGKAIWLDTRSERSGITTAADLARTEANSQISLDLPIASAREGVLSALGELSFNINAGYDHASDAGGQRLIGAGLNWAPIKPLSFIASWSKDEGVPSIQQLGNPLVTSTAVRIFDYVNGETVDITRITGGNPLLRADDRRVFKLGMTAKPFSKLDLTLTANYTDAKISDPVAGFPAATAAIQSAFASRFTRDASGRLVSVDARPINFSESTQRELRWGLNFSKQLSAPRPPAGGRPEGPRGGATPPGTVSVQDAMRAAGGGAPQGGGPGAGGPGAGPGGGGPGRFGGPGGFGGMRGTRMQFAVYHTVRLEDEILIAPGVPKLDLLNGDATSNAGGVSRHELSAQGGITHNGLGLRFSANWASGTTVGSGADRLRFSPLATVNLRLFANLGAQRDLVKKIPFLRGSRVRIAIDNLFNDRQKVRDSNGLTPLSFQPGYLDPLGRTISISFRKLFF